MLEEETVMVAVFSTVCVPTMQEAVIVAVPSPIPVTVPSELTFATFSLEDVNATVRNDAFSGASSNTALLV